MPTIEEKKALVSSYVNPNETGQQAYSNTLSIEDKKALIEKYNAPVTVTPTSVPVQETVTPLQQQTAYKSASDNFSKQLVRASINKTTGIPTYVKAEKNAEEQNYLSEINKSRTAMNLPAITTLPTTAKDEIKQQAENIQSNKAYADILKKITPLSPEIKALGNITLPERATVTKTQNQIIAEHMQKYETDPAYRQEMKTGIQQRIASERIAQNELTSEGKFLNDVQSFEGNFIDGLTQGAFTSGLFKEISEPYLNKPNYKQTLEALSNASPMSATIGNLAGSLVSQIAIQGMALQTLNAGMSLSKVSFSTNAVANLNKIAIGIGTQIPQSVFQRDSFKQIYDEKGEIAFEIARNAFSWYLGGNFERAMDNSLGKLITSEASLKGIRKLAYAALTKTPILYRAITEGAETMGQTIGSVAMGQTEYLTDPSYMLQNVGMDMLMLTVSGLMGVDGTNKAAIAKNIKKIRAEFDTAIKGADIESTDLVIARANAAQQIDELISKYDIKNLQMLQVAELSRDLLTLDAQKVQADTMTFEEAGKLNQMEQAANEDIAYQQTKDLTGQEPEVAVTTLKDGMTKDPPIGISKEEIQNSEFKTVRVNDNAMEFAQQMRKTFGVDIIFGQYDNQKINDSFKGAYTAENNTITINSSLSDVGALESVISHEIIHSMKATNPDAYNVLASYITTQAIAFDPEYKKHIQQAQQTTGKGENESVVSNANEEYLGDLFMAMYKLDNKFIDKAINNDKGMVKSFLNNIKRSALIQSNTKDMPILTAFKEINGLSKAMESALYKFANEPKVKVEVKAPKVDTTVVKKQVQTKEKTERATTTAQEAQQATSIAKDVKVPSETGKVQENTTKTKKQDLPQKPKNEIAKAKSNDILSNPQKKITKWSDIGGEQKVPEGKTYDEYQKMIDDYEDVLVKKYGEEEVLTNIPIEYVKNQTLEENRNMFGHGETKATNAEIAKLEALYNARDNVAKVENESAVEDIVKQITPIKDEWNVSRESIRKMLLSETEAYQLHQAIHGDTKDADIEATARKLYHDLVQSTDFPWDIVDYEDAVRELDRLNILGRTPAPLFDTINQLLKAMNITDSDYFDTRIDFVKESTLSSENPNKTEPLKQGRIYETTAEEVKYSQQSKDIMQSAITTMSYAESVEATKTAGRIKEQIGEGVYDRQIKSSKAFEQKAVDFLNENPDKVDFENNRIVAMLESGKKIDSEGYASAIALMKHYLKVDDVAKAENIFSLYIPAMSEQGRSLQAAKLLASTTPPGYLKVVESMLRRLNESGKKKYKGKWVNVELTAKERASILGTNMNDTKMRDYELLHIGQRIAAEMPHNLGDYFNAWRKLSMLSSVRTHARNFLSNVLYVPTQKLNNAVATALEKTIKIGTSAETTPWSVSEAVQTFGDGFKRLNKNANLALGNNWNELTLTSKSLDAVRSTNPNRPDQVESLRTMLKEEINGQIKGKSAEYFAKNKIIDETIDNWVKNNKGIDTATRTHALTKDAKLNQMIADDFKQNILPTLSRLNTDTISTRNVFGVEVMPFGTKKGAAQILNKISSFNSKMLNDVEDVPFYGIAYRAALNRYMKANNQTEITPVAREVAINKALEATYKQTYAFVTAVENLKKLSYGGQVVDVIMPFTRTPINIIMRGIENSPIGLAKGIFEAGEFMFGKTTAYEVNGKTRYRGDIKLLRKSIDDIAAGIGGTVVVALGVMAFQAGIVTGPPEDEYKLADYRKQVGESPYALHLGNLYFPLDWIQPTITPFVTGLAMAQAMITSGINPDGLLKAATAGGNVVLELPFLSTLQDLLSTNANAGGSTNAVYEALGKLATSYVSQMIPTIVGDVNRAVDNTQRSIYTPQDASVEGDAWNGLAQKLPYAIRAPIRSIFSKIAPQLLEAKVDIWGNELKRSPNAIANVAQSMFAPFLATQDKKTAVDKELIRLAGVDSSNTQLYPHVSPKNIQNTFNGVSTQYALDSAEYAGTWQKTAGSTAYKTLNTLIRSSAYKGVDDSLKAKAYSMAHEYSDLKADNQILKEKGVSGIVLNNQDDVIAEKLIELYIANKDIDSGTTAINYPRTASDTIAYKGKTYAFTQRQKNNYEVLLTTTTRTELQKVMESDKYLNADSEKQLELVNDAIDKAKENTTKNFMLSNKSSLNEKK